MLNLVPLVPRLSRGRGKKWCEAIHKSGPDEAKVENMPASPVSFLVGTRMHHPPSRFSSGMCS